MKKRETVGVPWKTGSSVTENLIIMAFLILFCCHCGQKKLFLFADMWSSGICAYDLNYFVLK